MVKEKKLIFTFDATKKARFGVLPRYAKNELLIKWFELPNCFIFHNGEAVDIFFVFKISSLEFLFSYLYSPNAPTNPQLFFNFSHNYGHAIMQDAKTFACSLLFHGKD